MQQTRTRTRTVVLEEDEWLGAMRAVIRRDYFPAPAGGEAPSALPSLDRFLQTHTSEDNSEFQARWREEVAQRQAKSSLLRLENSPSRMMLCAATTATGGGREINPQACQVLYPQANVPTAAVVAPATTTTTAAADKKDRLRLSQPALVLAERLRSKRRRL